MAEQRCPNPFCDGNGDIDVSTNASGRSRTYGTCEVGPHGERRYFCGVDADVEDTGADVPHPTQSTRTCPHCDGSGRGPQNGAWGALLTQIGQIPAECQNCGGSGSITVKTCAHCQGEFVPRGAGQALCSGCTYLVDVGGRL